MLILYKNDRNVRKLDALHKIYDPHEKSTNVHGINRFKFTRCIPGGAIGLVQSNLIRVQCKAIYFEVYVAGSSSCLIRSTQNSDVNTV